MRLLILRSGYCSTYGHRPRWYYHPISLLKHSEGEDCATWRLSYLLLRVALCFYLCNSKPNESSEAPFSHLAQARSCSYAIQSGPPVPSSAQILRVDPAHPPYCVFEAWISEEEEEEEGIAEPMRRSVCSQSRPGDHNHLRTRFCAICGISKSYHE